MLTAKLSFQKIHFRVVTLVQKPYITSLDNTSDYRNYEIQGMFAEVFNALQVQAFFVEFLIAETTLYRTVPRRPSTFTKENNK